jgi:NADPH:quinone reductase
VLINAIGGGVGLACTQLAVHAGARVIGTTGTPGKERRALAYGAERVVLTSREDFEKAVLDFSAGKGIDLAIDSYGATMLDRTFNVVKKLGHIISIGEAEGQPFKNIRERILPRSQTFTRLHLGHVEQGSAAWKAGIAHVLEGITAGWLKVPIEGVFALAEAAAMHRRLEGRHVSGKLLLQTHDI